MIEHLRQFRSSPRQLVLILLLALSGLYLHGTSLQSHLVNTNPRQTDQRAYIKFARELYETDYNYLVPRNQMPVYSLLQSLVYRPGMTEAEFFVVGKDFNVFLSILILAAVYWLFQKFFPPLMTSNLMLITGFTIFMFKAPFFQSELLFYFLNLIAFLLMLKMLRRPTILTGLVAGLVFGLAHMTKASVIPGLALFCLVMGLSILVDLYRRQPYKAVLKEKGRPLFLLLFMFLLSISVYITNSKKVYGHYFYNVNSTFYIWYDNWTQVKEGTIASGDHVGWPNMLAEDIPSLQKYFREHSIIQIADRFRIGLLRVLSNSMLSYGYFIYFVIYSLLFFTIALLNWRSCFEKVKQNYLLVSFVLAYFIFYLLAIAWYTPIATGNRFVLAYFLPFMFVLFYVLRSTKRYFGDQAGRLVKIVNLLVLCLLAGHIYYIMTNRIATFYGGL